MLNERKTFTDKETLNITEKALDIALKVLNVANKALDKNS